MRSNPWSEMEGRHLGLGRWHHITQSTVETYARLTYDEQYLHVDLVRATEKFGGTVVHGFYLLSLLPDTIFELTKPLQETHTYMFYGHDEVRVHFPVLTGSHVRYDLTVVKVTLLKPHMYRLDVDAKLEVQGRDRHAITCRYLSVVSRN